MNNNSLELSVIDIFQSASKLVDIRSAVHRKISAEALINTGVQISCPCREYARPREIIKPNDNEPHDIRIIEIALRKFHIVFPQLHNGPKGVCAHMPFVVRGACGLCPECQTLYYVHF